MDQISQRDKPLERTAKLTAKTGPKPWDIKQYTCQEPIDDQRPSHCDPRLEVAPQSHDPHQTDSDFIPSDDYGYGHPAFGIGFTPEFDASDPSASNQGTLAGGGCLSTPEDKQARERQKYLQKARKETYNIKKNWTTKDVAADGEYKKRLTIRRQVNDFNDAKARKKQ